MPKMSFKIQVALIFGFVVPATATLSTSAYADILTKFDFTYAATGCKFYGTQASDTFLTFGGGNRIKNGSAVDRNIVCPVTMSWYIAPVDNGFSLLVPLLKGVVNVTNVPGWEVADCNLFANAWDGSATVTYPSPSLSAQGVGLQYLWDWFDIGTTFDFGNRAFVCNTPTNGIVVKYESIHGVNQ